MTPHPVDIKSNAVYYSESEFVIPTKKHCQRVKKLLNAEIPIDKKSFIYLKGKVESTRDNTDVDLPFRQESNFFYLTGNSI
jgi:Xaa-Pro dipeptidase